MLKKLDENDTVEIETRSGHFINVRGKPESRVIGFTRVTHVESELLGPFHSIMRISVFDYSYIPRLCII